MVDVTRSGGSRPLQCHCIMSRMSTTYNGKYDISDIKKQIQEMAQKVTSISLLKTILFVLLFSDTLQRNTQFRASENRTKKTLGPADFRNFAKSKIQYRV